LFLLIMQTAVPSSRQGDGHLWMIALGLSMIMNVSILVLGGLAVLESAVFRKPETIAPPPVETTVTIFAEPAEESVAAPPETAAPKQFARSSEEQAAPPDKETPFMGERDTRATSDRAPVEEAPPLPSQTGIAPRDEADIETTQSDYQDGEIKPDPSQASVATPEPPVPVMPDRPAPEEPTPPAETAMKNPAAPGQDELRSVPPMREKLLEGPNPVDVNVPREVENTKDEEIKPTPEKRLPAESAPPIPKEIAKPAEVPKPKTTSQDPAFKGFQRKTAVVGSISRTGRSSLDVEDSPLGRYQASISRAVEQEWQRNCVRHRDFITPGFLTVRFFVETGGKVRSVQFVGDMETGEVQKGFTLNSIRDAEIPAMPPALRKEYDKEPLELIFRFFF
jgi:hypothetical protein